jgi:hypothetical protein
MGTLIQISELEMFEDKSAVWQVKEICEGNLLQE